jgi:hypothetical protein
MIHPVEILIFMGMTAPFDGKWWRESGVKTRLTAQAFPHWGGTRDIQSVCKSLGFQVGDHPGLALIKTQEPP